MNSLFYIAFFFYAKIHFSIKNSLSYQICPQHKDEIDVFLNFQRRNYKFFEIWREENWISIKFLAYARVRNQVTPWCDSCLMLSLILIFLKIPPLDYIYILYDFYGYFKFHVDLMLFTIWYINPYFINLWSVGCKEKMESNSMIKKKKKKKKNPIGSYWLV